MNKVSCPRCLQVWLSEDEPRGSDRLCTACLADLRAAGRDADRAYGKGYSRKKRERVGLNFFVVYVLGLAGLDLIVIGLALICPQPFGAIMLVYGFVLFAVGSVVFRWLAWGWWWWAWTFEDIDWDLAKWPAVAAVAGLVCMVASARLLV
jgi:hypothetical protein